MYIETYTLFYNEVMAISVDFSPKAYKFRLNEDYCLVNFKISLIL